MFNKNVKVLKTPLCEFLLVDENNKPISFDIVPNTDYPCEVWINSAPNQIVITKNCSNCRIRVTTDRLDLFTPYYLKSTKPLEWRDSDEGLFTYGITLNDKTLSISFPEHNEEAKYSQSEITKLIKYDIEEINPYTFKIILLDRSDEFIYMAVAWIWGIKDHIDDYEEAADVMTWTV